MPHPFILPSSVVLLVLSMALGGGARHGLMSDALPQMFSVIVLYFVIFPGLRQIRSSIFHISILIFVFGLPMLQLIPLPASLWQAMPGRSVVSDLYRSLLIEPQSLSWSLRPSETWRAFLSLLPALALALAIAALDLRGRIILILIALIFAVLNVFIALAQIIGGQNSSLYFYEITNRGRAVGLFANANHYTAYLYAMMPFAAALFSGSSTRSAPLRNAALGASLFLLIVGLSISGSRTAVILGGASLLLSVMLIAWKTIGTALSRGILRAAAVVVFLLALPILFGIGLLQIFVRFQTQDPFEDLRYQVLSSLTALARDYLPFGTGFGSFERIYQMREMLDTVSPFNVNHAHNDILELIIEGGAFSAFALLIFLIGLMVFTAKAFLQSGLIEERLEKAAVISLWLVSIHSAWDYPMRTIAVSSLFAMSFAILIKPTIINVETIADVMRHLKHLKLYDGIERILGRRRRHRHRKHRRPDLIVMNELG